MKKELVLTYDQAKEKALRLLEFRAHSEFELTQKLKHAGAKEEDISDILTFCRNYHFVNDSQYAIKKARDLQHLKRYGRRRILQELRAKGIDAQTAEAAVSELNFDDEEEQLFLMIQKRMKGNFERKNMDKTIRYFLYRGFDFSKIKVCIERLQEESS